MRGDQHTADGIDEGTDPVAEELRTHGVTQRRQILLAPQGRQRLLLLNGHAHLFAGDAGVEESGLLQLLRVAQVELAHQQVEAVEVVAHRQGGHTVDAGLEEFLGPAFAKLADDVAALLLAATGRDEHRQHGEQQTMATDVLSGEG